MGETSRSTAEIVKRITGKPVAELPKDRYVPNPDEAWRRDILGLDENHHPLVRRMAVLAERFARSCIRDNRTNGHWLTICGQTGAGKSHVARRIRSFVGAHQIGAIDRWIMKNAISSPAFIQWPVEVRRTDREWDVLMDECVDCHLVVIDDIGAEVDKFKSGEGMVRLWEVLEKSRNRWLLMTTNVRPLKWRDTFGQRCSDRMLEGEVVDLSDVPSYRTAIRA